MYNDQTTIRVESCEGNELIIRHGEAETIHEPKPMGLSGNFNAPAEFVRKRSIPDGVVLDIYPNSACHVLFNKKALSITLVAGEQNRDTITITGRLKKHPFLDSLGLNEKAWNKDALLKTIRFKGNFFADRGVHRELVTRLQRFEVKTSSEHQDVNDRLGNIEKRNAAKASSELAGMTIALYCPLFEGGQPASITFTIELEPNNGTVTLYLIAEEFEELWDTAVAAQFDAQRPVFEPFVIIDQD
ncbi:hypothetical protein [Rudanella lutea]|uniref:hypothetical protein n=1 Tax=Rudanella lutea TaxID=451374 RepID=UPI00038108A5|nr:hypothetical protein [Rudanella lutea]